MHHGAIEMENALLENQLHPFLLVLLALCFGE